MRYRICDTQIDLTELSLNVIFGIQNGFFYRSRRQSAGLCHRLKLGLTLASRLFNEFGHFRGFFIQLRKCVFVHIPGAHGL